jgi:hypothetical protein
MYDVWYTMGLAVMRPALLDAINAAGPVFNTLQRIIVEIGNGNQVLRPVTPNSGVLVNAPTTSVRLAIAQFTRAYSPASPPIGIFCAGRFSQLVTIPYFSSTLPASSAFKDIISLANQAYTKAIGTGAESTLASFPAFLGLCMLDVGVVNDFPVPTPALIEVAGEFGITIGAGSREWQIATAFTRAQEFSTATQLLMAGDSDPWECGCQEQAYFWNGFSEHAIL